MDSMCTSINLHNSQEEKYVSGPKMQDNSIVKYFKLFDIFTFHLYERGNVEQSMVCRPV